MKTSESLAVLIAFAFCFLGCKKEEGSNQPPTNNPSNNNNEQGPGDVYICGSVNVASESYPRYWKNGQEFELNTEGRPGTATSIWVNNDHVVVGGKIRQQGSVLYQPCYWIDDEFFELDNDAGSSFCTISDVFVVSGDQVYSSGHIRDDSGFNKAMYWNASIPIELTDGSKDAEAHGVWVDGGDVYVCGYEKDQAFGGSTIAKYWVNGSPVVLGSPDLSSFAYDIQVVNGDIVVVGTEESVSTGDEEAVIWVNGERTVLSFGAAGAAYCLFADGDDIYVGGYWEAANEVHPIYWLNFVGITPFELPPGTTPFGSVDGIFVYNNAIHTIGSLYYNTESNEFADYGNMYGLYVY